MYKLILDQARWHGFRSLLGNLCMLMIFHFGINSRIWKGRACFSATCLPLCHLRPYQMNCTLWLTGGSTNAVLCDEKADDAHPAPSAFNLLGQQSRNLLIFVRLWWSQVSPTLNCLKAPPTMDMQDCSYGNVNICIYIRFPASLHICIQFESSLGIKALMETACEIYYLLQFS